MSVASSFRLPHAITYAPYSVAHVQVSLCTFLFLVLLIYVFSKVLANTILLGWLQDVRCLGRKGKHGIVVSGEGTRDFSHVEERGSCWCPSIL